VSAFEYWPANTSPSAVGARLVTNYLARTRETYHYSDACAWYGALAFTKVTSDETRRQTLIKNFAPFLGGTTYYPATGTTVDDRVGGIVPLEIFIQTEDSTRPYEATGLKPADDQYGELDANIMSSRYWVDDMFMITSLQLQASRASGDAKYRDLSARAMLSYFTALQQSNGLFWHTRDSHVHWCRGNGWVAVGMAEMLLDLPAGTTRDQVLAGYRRMMAALKAAQIPAGQTDAGLWRQVLDHEESWAETSGSSMFTYSIATGVRNGWLDAAEYAPVARAGWLAVVGELDASANLTNVCVGTGAAPAGTAESQRDFYLGRTSSTGDLHGQAPLTWAATTFLRNYPFSN
jgi:unsaturated rhamnogalacturonyl hydrolase